MVVDGRLDEPEWASAQRFSDFTTTVPYTLAAPELRTEVLILAAPDGLHVGFIVDQPKEVERVRVRSQRDQGVEVDRVTMVIDLEGAGRAAYALTLSISDSIRDAVVTPVRDSQAQLPLTFNYDWDGDWDHAIVETDTQWFAEMRVPWTMAPTGEVVDGQQTIGLWFSRVVSSSAKRYARPGIIFEQPTFLRDMHRVTLKAYSSAQLDLFPYAAGVRDFQEASTRFRAGLDVFWRPHPQHQLTASINPDFGQVESDELVVNFSAIPTFFPDKRPFFTENLGLFSTESRVLYTRRIGAAPDAGPDGSSDILGAAKYTGNSGKWDFGLLAAVEDDPDDADGRQFYVGRLRRSLGDAFSLGWLGTHVERPTLDRHANVNTVDFNWTLTPGVTVLGQAMHSEVRRPGEIPSTPLDPAGSGDGGLLGLRYSGKRWDHQVTAVHYDRNFTLNDAGFLERNNLNQVSDVSVLHFRDYDATSPILESALTPSFNVAYNDQGDRLPAWVDLHLRTNLRNAGGIQAEWYLQNIGGVDDLVTRGHGPVSYTPQSNLYFTYFNPQTGFFRYVSSVALFQGLFSGAGWSVTLRPEFYFSERLIARFLVDYQDQPDFIIWQGVENLMATFRYRQVVARAGLEWYPAERHELRALLQWAGGIGKDPVPYRPDPTGNLHRTADEVGAFSFSDVAFQIRYRYQLAPLSDLYVVYTRGGGLGRADDERTLPQLFSDGLREQTASQFLVKIRYRFSLL